MIEDIVKDSLAHYSDPNYDPVERHERYMRTRQLKGRRVGASRYKPSTRRSKADTSQTSGARKRAQERADRIREKIRKKLEKKLEDVDWDVQNQIARLPKIPKYVSADTKARLNKARQQKIAQIMEDAGVKKGHLSKSSSEELSKELAKISKSLKSAISKARTRVGAAPVKKTVSYGRR